MFQVLVEFNNFIGGNATLCYKHIIFSYIIDQSKFFLLELRLKIMYIYRNCPPIIFIMIVF